MIIQTFDSLKDLKSSDFVTYYISYTHQRPRLSNFLSIKLSLFS